VSDTRRRLRPPAVAGRFYPGDPAPLEAALDESFAAAVRPEPGAPVPKALIVPHAGYVYSGPIAASAYLRIAPAGDRIERVVLLGPSHRVPFRGLALSSADAWASPLGFVPIDQRGVAELRDLAWVVVDDRPHAPEHSLEVQVPFLQRVLGDFELLPIVVGDASTHEVAAVIEAVWGGAETLVVVSTDLSHYHRYEDARRLDARTVAAIVALRPADVGDRDACGSRPLRGLLRSAAGRDLAVDAIDVRSSGDTAGDREQVVGYGAFALT
jgi:AmmeMemoRadiSam system protein B